MILWPNIFMISQFCWYFSNNSFCKIRTKTTKLMNYIPCSMGNYVCHHAILSRDHGYYVGARRFSTIGAVVDYFKDNPLGETFLKQEVRYSKSSFFTNITPGSSTASEMKESLLYYLSKWNTRFNKNKVASGGRDEAIKKS